MAIEVTGDMYITRDNGTVCLHRQNNVTMPTGLFRCEIPDANRTNQSILVNVVNNIATYDNMITSDFAVPTSNPSLPNVAVVAGASIGGLVLIFAGFVLVIFAINRYVDLYA